MKLLNQSAALATFPEKTIHLEGELNLMEVLPLLVTIINQLELPELFAKHFPQHLEEQIPPDKVLLVLLLNILQSRQPLYKVKSWCGRYPILRSLFSDEEWESFNDDRLGRMLERVRETENRSNVTREVTQRMIENFHLNTEKLHNDGTALLFSGDYDSPNAGTLKIVRGYNSENSDKKQLVFNPTYSADGWIPVECRIHDGNVPHKSTHLENYAQCAETLGMFEFHYVSDSSLCEKASMTAIDSQGGTFTTLMIKNRKEYQNFMKSLPESLSWEELYRRPHPRHLEQEVTYWGWEGELSQEGFRIIWIRSSQKQNEDAKKREDNLKRAQTEIAAMSLNRGALSSAYQIRKVAKRILKQCHCETLASVNVYQHKEEIRHQVGRGRPGLNTRYRTETKKHFEVKMRVDEVAIEEAKKRDGIFALITNRKETSMEEELKTYKQQPHVEKRHVLLKSILEVAPMWLKKTERVHGFLILYYLAIMVAGLLERRIQQSIQESPTQSVKVAPDYRQRESLTFFSLKYLFEKTGLTKVLIGEQSVMIHNPLSPDQMLVLQLLKMTPQDYWNASLNKHLKTKALLVKEPEPLLQLMA